jgi:serine protease Do
VTIVRDGSEKTLTVKLDEANPEKTARNEDSDSKSDTAALGIAVEPLTPALADRLGVDKDAKGVVVQDVNPDGRAADAGVQPGDVIAQVNRRPVQSVDDLRSAVKNGGNKPVLLLVNRKGTQIFMTVRPANG